MVPIKEMNITNWLPKMKNNNRLHQIPLFLCHGSRIRKIKRACSQLCITVSDTVQLYISVKNFVTTSQEKTGSLSMFLKCLGYFKISDKLCVVATKQGTKSNSIIVENIHRWRRD